MFDAIVIGSGMSGGIAAKELCERGLKVLVLERGGDVGPGQFTDHLQPWQLPNGGMIPEAQVSGDYPVQSQCYALSSATQQFFVKDSDHPYETPADQPFSWIRGYHKGGRSIMWGRQTYRLSEMDFAANARDGVGSDWPIRYADIAPWYDHIERFIGVAGSVEGLPQLPDGEFLPPFALNDAEVQFKASVESQFPGRKVIPGRVANLSEARDHHREQGRSPCQVRSLCERGCMFKAYHSSLNTSLPAAERTGNLTMVTDAIVESIIHDPATNRVTGVRVIDRNTKVGTTYEAKVIFSCASTIGTASILLQSASDAHPRGLANSSDMVGRNIMDHLYGLLTVATFDTMPDTFYYGRRPTGFYIPRYRNLDGQDADYLRGYGFQGGLSRNGGAGAVLGQPGLLGEELKAEARKLGPWTLFFAGFGEILPNRCRTSAFPWVRTRLSWPPPSRPMAGPWPKRLVGGWSPRSVLRRRWGWASTRWARPAWARIRPSRCSTSGTRRTTSPTCSSPMVRRWPAAGARTPRSPTWRCRPARRTTRCNCCKRVCSKSERLADHFEHLAGLLGLVHQWAGTQLPATDRQ
jgi:choline dehydrogenase-like flavoprotein